MINTETTLVPSDDGVAIAPRRAVVVGATGGIGRAVVARLSGDGLDVHAVGRRPVALDQLGRATGSTGHVADLADGDAVVDVFGALAPIDVLVFAAGVGGSLDLFHELDLAHVPRVLDANVTGLLSCVHAVLAPMVERRRGHIVVVGSIAGLYPLGSATYAASKGATHAFARSLRYELRRTAVRVTEICPGRVNTDCVPLANPDLDVRAMEPDAASLLQPEDVAAAIAYAVAAPAHVNVGLVELTPTCQVVGGAAFVDPLDDGAHHRPEETHDEQEARR